nr:dual-specificity RNA methyltransferase RlmN-like [Ipomoea batatas]
MSRCVWMRRIQLAGATSVFAAADFSVATVTRIPLSFTSVKPPLPRSLSSRRCLVTAAVRPSPPLDSTTLRNDNYVPAGDTDNKGVLEDCSKAILKGMRYTELEKWVQSHGYRPAQALMLWKRLYGNNIWAQCSEELEGLNKEFRKMLSEHAEFKALNLKDIRTASDGTKKNSQEVTDVIRVGRLHEIVEQAVLARRLLSSEVGPITNVVFMGMGEPLHNTDNVIRAADILVDEQGLHFSPRKVTISTSGLVPQLKRFLRESSCALAVSLNATTDEVRNWIMPINQKFNLNLLLGTLKEELHTKHNYKVLFEYVMLAGVNDSIEDAKRLIHLIHGIPCKINLISFNPHSGSLFKPTKEEKIIEFRNILAEAGCVVFLRLSRGDDQMAACGQLGNPGDIQAPLLRVPSQFQAALEASV